LSTGEITIQLQQERETGFDPKTAGLRPARGYQLLSLSQQPAETLPQLALDGKMWDFLRLSITAR